MLNPQGDCERLNLQQVYSSTFEVNLIPRFTGVHFMDTPTPFNDVDDDLLFKILETQVTLETVRDLMRKTGASFSASSWSDMIETRLKPALRSGILLKADLVQLIRQAEEHGRKHIRLFQYDPLSVADLAPAFNDAHVQGWARQQKFPTSGEYVFAAYPDTPTVTEVRVGDDAQADCFVLKIARTDRRRKQAVLQEWGSGEAYVAEIVLYRAVDVVKVHSNGFIEVRLDPRSERPFSYSGSALAAISYMGGLIDDKLIQEMSLANSKAALSSLKEDDLATKNFLLNQASLKNSFGDRVQSSSQAESGGMVASSVMPEVVEVFNNGDHDPYCEHVRVSYKYKDVKLINAILSEDINEVIFTASLTRDEYEDALNAILKLNEDE
jgi:hypothetical protein